MEATGVVIQVMEEQSFNDGKFRVQTFVIDTGDQFNPHLAVDVINRKLPVPKTGQRVTVSLNVYSTRGKGANAHRYFNNVRAWKIVVDGKTGVQPEPSIPATTDDDGLPF